MIFTERVQAPLSWWAIGLVTGVTTATAIGFYLGPWVAIGAGVVTIIGIVIALLSFGFTTTVTDRGLKVGASEIEWEWTGDVQHHDASATDRLLGPDANARAFVTQRPWMKESVQVEVRDEADPHPYWLISSRQPAQLAAAIIRAQSAARAA